MSREELNRWLLRAGRKSGTRGSGDARRFVLAALRDRFPTDAEVEAWLAERRPELGGRSAASLLATARADDVEDLAVREWNRR